MILLTDLYKNKKVCLMGSGDSISRFSIDFDSYDLVVGINRIYKTNYINHINILYNGLGIKDWKNIVNMINLIKMSDNIEYLIACPWVKDRIRKLENMLKEVNFSKNYICCRNIVRKCPVKKGRPLTGVSVLNHIILSDAETVDIYGFDFYKSGYVGGIKSFDPRKHHDLNANKKFLQDLIVQYPGKINWFL
jgi:hypothetical protein